MRVLTDSLADFIENIDGEDLFRKTVRASSSSIAINEVKHEVLLHLSTIVVINENQSYIVEMNQSCGHDYKDASKETVGSDVLSSMVAALKVYAEKHDLKIKPGILDY